MEICSPNSIADLSTSSEINYYAQIGIIVHKKLTLSEKVLLLKSADHFLTFYEDGLITFLKVNIAYDKDNFTKLIFSQALTVQNELNTNTLLLLECGKEYQ